MHIQICYGLAILSFAQLALSVSPFLDIRKVAPPAEDQFIPNQYIVEFEDPGALQKRSGSTPAEGFFEALKDAKIRATPKLNFTSRIFKGASFRAEKVDISELRKHRDVKRVWQASKIPRPLVEIAAKGKTASTTIGGSIKWTNHLKTGVMDLQAQGYRGKDILIAVIDSGIDYTHPALGGGIGPGKKIVGGYDFVGDLWDGTNDPIPDDDPMDTNGHGTHVAGIIAASNSPQMVGVAPEAKLLAYKVFSKGSLTTSDDVLIESFLKAYDEGADIITASVAGVSGWQDGPWAAVASRLVEKGVFVSIAAGNQGLCGPGYSSDGSSGALVTGVGSVENDLDVSNNLNVNFTLPDGTKIIIGYYDKLAWDVPKMKVWTPLQAIGLPTEDKKGCVGLPEDTPDLSNLFVLFEYIDNPACSFEDQMRILAKHKAKYSFWWQNFYVPYNTFGQNGVFSGVKTAQISLDDGEFLRLFIELMDVMISFADPLVGNDPRGVNNTISGGKMSYFSSWGLTNNLDIKPDISAPGGNIFSTYPENDGSYAILSGTSMATPYIAGIAALFAQKYGGKGAMRKNPYLAVLLRGKMINGANGLPLAVPVLEDGTIAHTDYSVLAPIPQQGGGYVNATSVLLSPITISPHKLALNDQQYFRKTHRFQISSSASHPITFSLSNFVAATVYLRDKDQDGFHMPLFPEYEKAAGAQISFSSNTVTVPANGHVQFEATFTPPQGLEERRLPTYSGKIILLGSNGEKFEIPYSGIVASLNKYSPMRAGYPRFTFTQPSASSALAVVSPSKPLGITYRLNLPTAELRFDVIETSVVKGVDPASDEPSGLDALLEWIKKHFGLDFSKFVKRSAVEDLGVRIHSRQIDANSSASDSSSTLAVSGFKYPPPKPGQSSFAGRARGKKSLWPRKWLPRDLGWDDVLEPGTENWYGELGDDVKLKDGGKYKAAVRALAWNGNPEKESDWFEFWSEEFIYRKE